MVLKILKFRWFEGSPEMALHNKIINKIWLTKNQENSAHGFVDNYLTNHLANFLKDRIKPWRVGALRVCTAYHFFLKKVKDFLTFFNLLRASC